MFCVRSVSCSLMWVLGFVWLRLLRLCRCLLCVEVMLLFFD